MVKKCFCDRCGREQKEEKLDYIAVQLFKHEKNHYIQKVLADGDLCPICFKKVMKKFKKLMELEDGVS